MYEHEFSYHNKMDWMLSDNRKIGGFMLCFGILFMFLGVIFFFDKALLALGNILFLGVRTFFLIFSQFILTHHNLAFVVCMVTYVFVLLCLLCLICSRTLSLSHTHTHIFFNQL